MTPVRSLTIGCLAAAVLAMAAGPAPAQRADAPPPAVQRGPADFTEIVRTLAPTVVAVTTRSQAEELEAGDHPDDGPFGGFFRRFFDERGPQFRQRRQRASLGSGFVIDNAGHIVTNNHVITNASEIRVVLADRSTRTAHVLGRDPATDLAVLRIDGDTPGLPSAQWGDSDAVQPGAWTIAIGSPFGLGGTVTVGVLSARSRNIQAGPYDDFLQTDASINSGNSGGPLFDAQGRVIGVNTAIVSPSGGNIGIGFAIPANIARGVVQELIQKGRVERGFIGVSLQQVTPAIARSLGLDRARGALVASVVPGGPAERAGLRPGDVITRLGTAAVESSRDLARQVASARVGEELQVELLRRGQQQSLALTVGQQPGQQAAAAQPSRGADRDQGQAAGARRLGVVLAPIGSLGRGRLGLGAGAGGVVVERVEPGSPAAGSGIQEGDVIVAAGDQPVDDPSDVAQHWQEANAAARPMLLRIRRGDSYLYVSVEG